MARIIPIISVIILILLILGGVFLGWPKYKEFKELNAQIKIKEETLGQKQEYLSKLNTLSRRLEDFEEELAKINSALPEEILQPELLHSIQKMTSENGLILEEISSSTIAPPGQTGEIQTISIEISVSGSYEAFKNFLSAIYKKSRIIEVDSIQFSSPKDEKSLMDFNLALRTHYYPKSKIGEQISAPGLEGGAPR